MFINSKYSENKMIDFMVLEKELNKIIGTIEKL